MNRSDHQGNAQTKAASVLHVNLLARIQRKIRRQLTDQLAAISVEQVYDPTADQHRRAGQKGNEMTVARQFLVTLVPL